MTLLWTTFVDRWTVFIFFKRESQSFHWERMGNQSGPTGFKGGNHRKLTINEGGGIIIILLSHKGNQVSFIMTQPNFYDPPPQLWLLHYHIFPVSIHAVVYPSMIAAPKRFINVFIGETVSFRWHYNSGDLKNDLFEVVFGIWKSPGFLKTKLIAVNSSGFASTRSSYKSSVGWAGNLTSSVAVFELYNVKLEDGKTYGIVVEYGLQNTPLTDSVQLQVVSRRK